MVGRRMKYMFNKLAKLQATLVRNYDLLTDLLTGVKCRATSVAKKPLYVLHLERMIEH